MIIGSYDKLPIGATGTCDITDAEAVLHSNIRFAVLREVTYEEYVEESKAENAKVIPAYKDGMYFYQISVD